MQSLLTLTSKIIQSRRQVATSISQGMLRTIEPIPTKQALAKFGNCFNVFPKPVCTSVRREVRGLDKQKGGVGGCEFFLAPEGAHSRL
jgi:hypothetical protein